MPLRYIGRQIRRFNNACNTSTRQGNFLRVARNTVLGYTGIKAAGMLTSYFTGNRDLEMIADLAAPVVMGGYAMSQSDSFSTGVAQSGTIIVLATVAGADVSSHIMDYHGSNDLFRLMRDSYSQVHMTIANKITDVHDPAFSGAAIGGLAGIISRVMDGYRN